MQCPSCGASLPEGAQSCLTCGRVFVSAPSPEAAEQAPGAQTPPQPEIAPMPPVYAPPSQPWYSAPPSMPLAGAQSTVPLPRGEPFDARRFVIGGIPLWAGIVALITAVVTFGVGVFALKKDWADSAWIAAFVTLAGAGIILTAVIVMLSLSRFQWLTLGLSALLLVALSGSGAYALTNQPAIHRVQARVLENNEQWQASIHEYSLAGEQSPNAPDTARVELEWGEQYYSIQRYREATNLYLQAFADDDSDVTTETRARKDLYQSYVAWLYANPPDDAYAEIGSFLEKYMQFSICDSDCRSFTRPLAALAFYNSGAAIVKRSVFSCDSTIAIYKDLVARYGDTPSGQKAATSLAAPVTYVARIDGFPAHATTPAYLSRRVQPTQSGWHTFSNDYTATVDSDGAATFHNIPPGSYNFSIVFKGELWYWDGVNDSDILSAKVTPVCGNTQYFGWI